MGLLSVGNACFLHKGQLGFLVTSQGSTQVT